MRWKRTHVSRSRGPRKEVSKEVCVAQMIQFEELTVANVTQWWGRNQGLTSKLLIPHSLGSRSPRAFLAQCLLYFSPAFIIEGLSEDSCIFKKR